MSAHTRAKQLYDRVNMASSTAGEKPHRALRAHSIRVYLSFFLLLFLLAITIFAIVVTNFLLSTPSSAHLNPHSWRWLFGGSAPTPDLYSLTTQISQRKYRNQVVLRFNVTTADEEAALVAASELMLLDVWAFTTEYVDIQIHKDYIPSLLTLLPASLAASSSIWISDLSAAIHATYPSAGKSPAQAVQTQAGFAKLIGAPAEKSHDATAEFEQIFFQNYQPLPVVENWMRLVESLYPSFVELITIGQSFEGRDIQGLRIGSGSHQKVVGAEPRRTLIITGGLHAREWITTTTVNYVAWAFIQAYGRDSMITRLLDEYDLVFLPALNPDGTEYTWQNDRLWRKSRQKTNLNLCPGLDLDHAFGYEWNALNQQTDPCSESYGGDRAFESVEAKALADWALDLSVKNEAWFVGLIDLHSYSQQVLIPYSFSCSIEPPNMENLSELAAGLAKALRLSGGESYTVASACEGAFSSRESRGATNAIMRLEASGGSAIDWFYHELHARYSYQIKLRDTGSYGFLLPKEAIVPTGVEVFSAMKYLGDFLLGNNGIERWQEGTGAAEGTPLTSQNQADDSL